jgi:parallel beta-helix repeat protein
MRYTRDGAPTAFVGAPYLTNLLVVALLTVVAMVVEGFASTEADGRKRRGIHCGKVLYRSVTLRRDITGCKGSGLTAGRSGITIRLNGHTLGGLGEGVGLKLIDVRRVKVRGGTVRGFELGLRVVRSHRNRFRRINLSGNSDAAIEVFGSNGNRFRGLRSRGNGDAAIRLSNSHGSRLIRNKFRGNGDVGILLYHSNRAVVRRNKLRGNGDAGILLEGSHRSRIRRNTTKHNSDSGIGLEESSFTLVAGNRAFGNGEGITADGGKRNRIVRNRANHNGGAGIEVGSESRNTRVKGNVSRWNGGDGIYIEGARTRLVRNRATCNGGMGIKAVVGLFARRNWAAANGDAKGCEGVRCRRMPRYRGCYRQE